MKDSSFDDNKRNSRFSLYLGTAVNIFDRRLSKRIVYLLFCNKNFDIIGILSSMCMCLMARHYRVTLPCISLNHDYYRTYLIETVAAFCQNNKVYA